MSGQKEADATVDELVLQIRALRPLGRAQADLDERISEKKAKIDFLQSCVDKLKQRRDKRMADLQQAEERIAAYRQQIIETRTAILQADSNQCQFVNLVTGMKRELLVAFAKDEELWVERVREMHSSLNRLRCIVPESIVAALTKHVNAAIERCTTPAEGNITALTRSSIPPIPLPPPQTVPVAGLTRLMPIVIDNSDSPDSQPSLPLAPAKHAGTFAASAAGLQPSEAKSPLAKRAALSAVNCKSLARAMPTPFSAPFSTPFSAPQAHGNNSFFENVSSPAVGDMAVGGSFFTEDLGIEGFGDSAFDAPDADIGLGQSLF